MWWLFQVLTVAESFLKDRERRKNVAENKVRTANTQVSNSIVFGIKCRAQDVAHFLFLFLKKIHNTVNNSKVPTSFDSRIFRIKAHASR